MSSQEGVERAEAEKSDVVFLIAVRAKPAARTVGEVLAGMNLTSDEAPRMAYVIARELPEAYSLPNRPAAMHNLNDLLVAAGFSFGEANEVVPVYTEGEPDGTE